MIGYGCVHLTDVAFHDTAFDGHGPHGNQTKVAGAGDRDRNDPTVGGFLGAGDAQRLGDEDAESFARVVAEPPGVEAMTEAKFEIALGAFGDDRDIGLEIVEWLTLAGQSHSTIPDDDSHEVVLTALGRTLGG